MKKAIVVILISIMLSSFAWTTPINGETKEIYDYNTIWIHGQQKKDFVPLVDVNITVTFPYQKNQGYMDILIKKIYPESLEWKKIIQNQLVDGPKPNYECWRSEKQIYCNLRIDEKGIYEIKATLTIFDEDKTTIIHSNTQHFFVEDRKPYFLEQPKEIIPIVVIENMTSIQHEEDVLFKMKLKPCDINFENTFFFIDVYNNTLPLLSYKLGKIKNCYQYCDFTFCWTAPNSLFKENYDTALTYKIRAVEHDNESPIKFYGNNIGELVVPKPK